MSELRQTIWIRYRRKDGGTVTEGGKWRPQWAMTPSFERTGMEVHKILSSPERSAQLNLENWNLVGVDAMIWKMERI